MAGTCRQRAVSHGPCNALPSAVAPPPSTAYTVLPTLPRSRVQSSRFTQYGVRHYEMYFPDGTCPSEQILLRFLEVAEREPGALAVRLRGTCPERLLAGHRAMGLMSSCPRFMPHPPTDRAAITSACPQVHCKAGLGRTGVLICAYMIKHFGFSAEEAMGYIRVCRPGSVIGPQQHYLAHYGPALQRLGQEMRAAKGLDAPNGRIEIRADATAAAQARPAPPAPTAAPPASPQRGPGPGAQAAAPMRRSPRTGAAQAAAQLARLEVTEGEPAEPSLLSCSVLACGKGVKDGAPGLGCLCCTHCMPPTGSPADPCPSSAAPQSRTTWCRCPPPRRRRPRPTSPARRAAPRCTSTWRCPRCRGWPPSPPAPPSPPPCHPPPALGRWRPR